MSHWTYVTEHSLIDENGECVYQDDIIKWRLVK